MVGDSVTFEAAIPAISLPAPSGRRSSCLTRYANVSVPARLPAAAVPKPRRSVARSILPSKYAAVTAKKLPVSRLAPVCGARRGRGSGGGLLRVRRARRRVARLQDEGEADREDEADDELLDRGRQVERARHDQREDAADRDVPPAHERRVQRLVHGHGRLRRHRRRRAPGTSRRAPSPSSPSRRREGGAATARRGRRRWPRGPQGRGSRGESGDIELRSWKTSEVEDEICVHAEF